MNGVTKSRKEVIDIGLLEKKESSHILPFLWLKGESSEDICNEIAQINKCGIKQICVESRPHPDFLGEGWWRDLDLIIEQAQKHGMKIWILDDDKFPTGHCNGAFETKYPELKKIYLAVRYVDIHGPCVEGSILIENFLPSDGAPVSVVAYKKPNTETTEVCFDDAIDLSDCISGGFVHFNLPPCAYRLAVIYTTRSGGGRDNYMNLIDSRSVKVLLDEVYEPHYRRYSELFGDTILGFFSDEPELGNVPGYGFDVKLGSLDIKLPWSDELQQALLLRWQGEFRKNLFLLFCEGGEVTSDIRYEYMDCLTLLVKNCFSSQVGRWCEEHGVSYIGHIIEDDNAHSRLGCSIGHYYREMDARHMAGIDVVHHQIVPGFTGKYHKWVAGDKDGEFFHFGLTKPATTLARLDAKKQGRSLCEIFGNYGWAEDVTFMRWLVDHMLVRGINYFTPHAFSMTFPDRDCPPHFYAKGNNPQFGAFCHLMHYTERVAQLLSEKEDYIETAVLYHAEADWIGDDYMLFQKPVRELMENQIDCDVVPIDMLKGATFKEKRMTISTKSYSTLIIPTLERVQDDLKEFIVRATAADFPVVFVDRAPNSKQQHKVVALNELAKYIKPSLKVAVQCKTQEPELRALLLCHDDEYIAMFFNESRHKVIDTEVVLKGLEIENHSLSTYEAWSDRVFKEEFDGTSLKLVLNPGEPRIFLLTKTTIAQEEFSTKSYCESARLDGDWQIEKVHYKREVPTQSYIKPKGEPFKNINGMSGDVNFSGYIHYRTEFENTETDNLSSILCIDELGGSAEIIINGVSLGHFVTFPLKTDITKTLRPGRNDIEIIVATTLVYDIKDGASTHLQTGRTGLLCIPVIEYKIKESYETDK